MEKSKSKQSTGGASLSLIRLPAQHASLCSCIHVYVVCEHTYVGMHWVIWVYGHHVCPSQPLLWQLSAWVVFSLIQSSVCLAVWFSFTSAFDYVLRPRQRQCGTRLVEVWSPSLCSPLIWCAPTALLRLFWRQHCWRKFIAIFSYCARLLLSHGKTLVHGETQVCAFLFQVENWWCVLRTCFWQVHDASLPLTVLLIWISLSRCCLVILQ